MWRGVEFWPFSMTLKHSRTVVQECFKGDEASRCLDVMSETWVKHDCRGAENGSIRHNWQFEVDTFWDAQPVRADERWGNVF